MARGSVMVTGLALGVAAGALLGTYVLAPNVDGSEDRSAVVAAEQQRDDAETRAEVADSVIDPSVIDGVLDGTPVLVLATADAEATSEVRESLNQAGAQDAGTVTLTEKFVSASDSDELKDLVTSALPAGTQLDVDRRDPGIQAGGALAPVFLLDDAGAEQASVADRRLLLTTLRDAGFIDYEDGTLRPAAMIVLVAGAGVSPGDDPSYGGNLLADFADTLAHSDDGGPIVIATQPDSLRDGVAGAVSDLPVVPAVDTEAGRVAVIQQLVELLERSGEAGDGDGDSEGDAEATEQPAEDQPAEQQTTEE